MKHHDGPPTPVLATDLDGTLIPLPPGSTPERPEPSVETATGDADGNAASQSESLEILRRLARQGKLDIVFVTGRHHDSVVEVMRSARLPTPRWIICDVGTTLLDCSGSTDQPYRPVADYVNHLDALIGGFTTERLRDRLGGGEGLVLQEPEKQGRHKLSFYCDADKLESRTQWVRSQLDRIAAPYRIVSSVDPFNGDGLIDLLPTGTDKSSALTWWAERQRYPAHQLVFAGDSGNDFAALTAGFRAILVGNADRDLARKVVDHHQATGTPERIYLARGYATAGVLEGCRRYGLVANQADQDAGVIT